jgi:hypothetical protein
MPRRRRLLVQRPRHQLLAGAAGAGDQRRRIGGRDPLDELADAAHRRACAEQAVVAAGAVDGDRRTGCQLDDGRQITRGERGSCATAQEGQQAERPAPGPEGEAHQAMRPGSLEELGPVGGEAGIGQRDVGDGLEQERGSGQAADAGAGHAAKTRARGRRRRCRSA